MVGEGGWDLLLVREEQTEGFWGIANILTLDLGRGFVGVHSVVCVFGMWTFSACYLPMKEGKSRAHAIFTFLVILLVLLIW